MAQTAKPVTVEVRVVPGARCTEISLQTDGVWKVRLRERAVEGRANAALLEQFAEWLDVAKSRVVLLRGEGARRKVLGIYGLAPGDVRLALAEIASRSGGHRPARPI